MSVNKATLPGRPTRAPASIGRHPAREIDLQCHRPSNIAAGLPVGISLRRPARCITTLSVRRVVQRDSPPNDTSSVSCPLDVRITRPSVPVSEIDKVAPMTVSGASNRSVCTTSISP